MIQTVGTRRLVILAVLIGINLLFAAVTYIWLIPQSDALETKATAIQQKASASRSNTVQMTSELDIIQKQKESFGKLQAANLFSKQDRVDARDRIQAIQKYSRVLSASYDIKPAVVEHSERLTAAGQVVLSTPLDVTVNALDDVDLYNFAYYVKNGFPGFMGIQSVEIQRPHELDENALRDIGSGKPVTMISGKISFIWKTIIDEKLVKADEFTPQAGM